MPETKVPETTNPHFDGAIKELLKYHKAHEWPGIRNGAVLILENKPKMRSRKDWEPYLDALVTVLVIGKRNGWLRLHINRRGRTVFWLIDVLPKKKKKGGANCQD